MREFLNSGALLASRPGFVRLAWGSWRASAVAADSGPSFFIPDFFLTNSRPWAIPSQWRELPVSDFLGELSRWEEPVPELFWERPDLDEFRRSFEDLQRRFAAGQLKKAVPVVFECASLPFSPGMRATVLRNLLQRSGGRTRVYGFWNDEGGILGASPEDLFTLSTGNALRTMALAGTYRKKEGFDFSSILRDPKERREHQLVIDDLREALVPFGEVRVGETEVLELPSLVHLKTELEARLNEAVPFERLARALHPTAALGAFPRPAGWEWLQSRPGARNRKRFGAPFGLLWSPGTPGTAGQCELEATCVVAIRNIQWEGERVVLGSGCGLIAESVLEREWDELSLKRESVKRMMGLP